MSPVGVPIDKNLIMFIFRSLAQWLHHLEEHINSTYIDTGAMPTPATVPSNSKVNNRIGSFAVTANKVSGGLPFAAINEAGPMPLNCWDGNGSRSASCGTKLGGQSLPHTNSDMPNILWNTDLPQIAPKSGSQDYICDDHVIREFRKTIGRNMDGSTTATTALVPILKSASSSLNSCKSTVSSASSSASSTSSISSSSGKAGSGSMALVGSSAKDSPAVFVAHPSEATATGTAPTTEQEDLHVSFSKNGTEILDFDCDDDNKSNTQIAFEAPPPPINPRMVADAYLAVPHHLDNCFCGSGTPSGQCALLISTNAMKTRRSNSLTTAPVTVAYPGSQGTSSSSTENLLQLKPRSYSLSIESHRGSLISCGSEEMKPSGLLKMGGGNPGMNCIGQWLKSLRLHKYVWLFSNITYEQMMDISEEYLANLSVTKGARHKLVLCIQKLKERGSVLLQMEQTLLAGETHVAPLLEELTNIVLTPMKPIDPFSKDNVAGLFIKVVEMGEWEANNKWEIIYLLVIASLFWTVGSILVSRPIQGPTDEEHVTAFLWILERALHNEAFLGQMNLLKELKFKVSKIKLQFVNKPHFGKGIGSVSVGAGGGGISGGVVATGGASAIVASSINKARWPGVTTAKKPNTTGVILSQPPPVCIPGLERKNSGPPVPSSFSAMVQTVGQQQQPSSQLHLNNLDEKNYFNALSGKVVLAGGSAGPQQQYSKSSSYPSFSQNLKFSNPHMGHTSIVGAQGKSSAPSAVVQQQQQQQMEPLSKGFNSNSANHHHHQQQQQMTSLCNSGTVGVGGGNGGGGNTIYHRHSMNSLMSGNVGHSLVGLTNTTTTTTTPASDKKLSVSGVRQENNENIDIGNQCKDKNNICDINSRLEFLCLQMTEQAIN